MTSIKRLFPGILVLYLLIFLQGCNSGPAPEKSWRPESDGILSADVSSSGRFVLLGTDKGKANLWDLEDKAQLTNTWKHQDADPDGISAVAIAENEKSALTANNKSLAWWDLKAGGILGYWRLKGIKSLAISADGKYALLGFKNYAIYLSLANSKNIHILEHPDYVKTVAISKDGRFALTGGDNQEARLWSLRKGDRLHTWKYTTKLKTVDLSPDGEIAITNPVLGETRLWKTDSGKLIHALPPKRVTLPAIDFASTGEKLVTARALQRIDVWMNSTGESLLQMLPKKSSDWRPSSATILSIRFVEKDKKVVSVSSNGFVEFWNAE